MALSDVLSAPSRQVYLSGFLTYLTGRTEVFSGQDVIAFSMSEGASSGTLLGGAFSSSCALTLNNASGRFTFAQSPYGAQLQLYLNADAFVTPLIVATVTKVSRRPRDPRLILKASDALGTAFNGLWRDTLTYPATLLTIARSIASRAGFDLEDASFPQHGFSIPQKPDWGDVTLRQALAWVACACGCFAQIDRRGNLTLRRVYTPSSSPFVIPAQNILQQEAGERAFGPVRAVRIECQHAPRDANPLVSVQSGYTATAQNTLAVSRNPLFPYGGSHVSNLASAMRQTLQGMVLRPVHVSWQGNPDLTLGDPVRIVDQDGQATNTIVTFQSLALSRGFSMQTDCTAPTEKSAVGRLFTSGGALNASMLEGSIDGALIRNGSIAASSLMAGSIDTDRLAANAVTTEKIKAGAVTADKIAAGAITADKLSAGSVTADKIAAEALSAIAATLVEADIDWADIENLTAAVADIVQAQIGTADIDFAHVMDLVSGQAIITRGEAGKLYIANLAVTEANMASLTVGELLVRGQDGAFYAVMADGQGNVTTQRKQVANGDIENLAIDGDAKLIEGSITAKTLNAQDIFADSALIRQMMAANIDVDTLFSRQAVISALAAAEITGDQSLSFYVSQQKALAGYVRIEETEDESGQKSAVLIIGREGDSARFLAGNRTMEVTNIKTERLGLTQSMTRDEEWIVIAASSGLGIKYIGETEGT